MEEIEKVLKHYLSQEDDINFTRYVDQGCKNPNPNVSFECKEATQKTRALPKTMLETGYNNYYTGIGQGCGDVCAGEGDDPGLFTDDSSPCLCNDFVSEPITSGVIWTATECLDRMNSILKKNKSSPDSQEKVFRLWNLYMRKAPQGVFFKDILNIMDIIKTLNNNYANTETSSMLLRMMIPHAKKMLQLRAQSDCLEINCLINALSIAGNLLTTGNEEIQIGLVQIILNWIQIFEENAFNPIPKHDCLSKSPVTKNTKSLNLDVFVCALEKSNICKLLTMAIIEWKLHEDMFLNALEIFKFACENSQLTCNKMIQRPILEALLDKLATEENSNVLLARSIDFMYALFSKVFQSDLGTENSDKLDKDCLKMIPTPSHLSFQILLVRFGELMASADSKFLVQLRNDVAFTILFMTKQIPGLRKHNNNNFAKYICEMLVANIMAEVEERLPDLPKTLQLDSTPEDWELLNYLLGWIAIVIQSSFCKKLISDYNLVKVFSNIVLLKIKSSLLDVLYDHPELQPQLMQTAWYGLEIIATVEPLAFVRQDDWGYIQHIRYMARLRQDSLGDLLDFKYGFSKLAQILRMLLSHGKEEEIQEILDYFLQQDAIEIYSQILKHMSACFFDITEEAALCNILLTCAIICEKDCSQREAFAQAKGVRVLTRLINQLVMHPAIERHMNPLLHIAIAQCVSKCIAFSPSALELFLAYEGVLALLDLLEVAAGPSAVIHILTCLLELCEYSRCMDQLLYWKRSGRKYLQRNSHNHDFDYPLKQGVLAQEVKPQRGDKIGDYIISRDKSFSALLCEIWRCEEKRFAVLRDEDGCIASIEKPLMGEFARNFTSLWRRSKGRIKPSEFPGPSCLDLIASVRPKIFLLVKRITEGTNTEATVFGGLGVQNQVTMQIIINFLDLKRGEIWMEMIEELTEDNVQLVASDQQAFEIFKNIGRNKVAAVLDTQQYLIRRSKEHDEITEKEFYSLMKECKLQDHLLAAREVQYLARSSNYLFMAEKRLWQKAQLRQNVLSQVAKGARLHRTANALLNCTAWPGGTKSVLSEPNLEPDKSFPVDVTDIESSVLADMLKKDIQMTPSVQQITTIPRYKTSHGRGSDEIKKSFLSVASKRQHSQSISFAPEKYIESRSSKRVSSLSDIKEARSELDQTPRSAEEGYYQVSPILLKKVLLQLQADQNKWNWDKIMNDENAWTMRSKWKSDWYPESVL